jgi:multidrug resistance efflux pump
MLNISESNIRGKINFEKLKSYQIILKKNVRSTLLRTIGVIGAIILLGMFLPWTQNIRAKGYVTTLNPDERPQTVQALIGGKIEKWFVREGEYVDVGDTIMIISEAKEEYLDPNLLNNTSNQISSKKGSSNAYAEKADNLQEQYVALNNARSIKLKQNAIKVAQTKLKIQSDSLELVAAETNMSIAEAQLTRTEKLFNDGLKPLTDLELKRSYYQGNKAKVLEIKNKIVAGRNDLDNLRAEIIAINNDYADKIAKSQSERMSALSSKFDADANINKLTSDLNAYAQRANNYVIKSPISGYVTKAIKVGLGEIIKNGDQVVSIMPKQYTLALEMYVEPVDLPLVKKDQKVMIQFDGWPAIVFSGWPNNSFGTYYGKVFAIDNFISENGKYRVMVAEEDKEKPWPNQIRVGSGANTISLLKNVLVGYELWRQINGFPPDYYVGTNISTASDKK